MKTSLEHLPLAKQRELERVTEILFEEFEAAPARKKRGRILKIILFGSFARGGWVEDRASGYYSDYDILIVVNDDEMTDFEIWETAEDRLMRHPGIRRDVQIIVEPLHRVNDELAKGQYFFSDIRDEGIALYEAKGKKLAKAKPLNEAEYVEIAKMYFKEAFTFAQSFPKTARLCISEKSFKHAAFELHQAAEHAYRALLLTLTHYSPAIHNIRKLRGFAEDLDHRLIDVWPRHHRRDKRKFELLRRAYVEARYSEHYEITVEELEWLEERVLALHKVVEVVCRERLGG